MLDKCLYALNMFSSVNKDVIITIIIIIIAVCRVSGRSSLHHSSLYVVYVSL